MTIEPYDNLLRKLLLTTSRAVYSNKGDCKMKRRILILFALLCMGTLFIGASDSASMLSDREMAQITGACCYVISHKSCRWAGDIECNSNNINCIPTQWNCYHNNYWNTCSSSGAANNKKCSDGTVACYTPYWVIDNGWASWSVCTTAAPPWYDPTQHGGYYFWCTWAPNDCKLCTWNGASGASSMKDDDSCVPI
jgi:hypothetical protein